LTCDSMKNNNGGEVVALMMLAAGLVIAVWACVAYLANAYIQLNDSPTYEEVGTQDNCKDA